MVLQLRLWAGDGSIAALWELERALDALMPHKRVERALNALNALMRHERAETKSREPKSRECKPRESNSNQPH